MGVVRVGLALVLTVGLVACGGENPSQTAGPLVKGGSDETGEYIAAANFWKPAPDHTDRDACPGGGFGGGGGGGGGGQASTEPCWVWGEVSGMAADSPDRIIVAVWGDRERASGEQRVGGSNYLIEVDGNGDIIKRWTQWDSLFNTPHQVYISPYDPERAIYVVERGGRRPSGVDIHEAVYKFSNDGETLIWGLRDPQPKLSRSEQRAMTDLGPTDFGNPSVLTFLSDGEHFLLADGYDNGRVQTWTTDGEWVSEFGEVDPDPAIGGPPGAFDLMHGIAVDGAGRIYVGDRRNNRVQVFTPEGEFVEEWPGVIDSSRHLRRRERRGLGRGSRPQPPDQVQHRGPAPVSLRRIRTDVGRFSRRLRPPAPGRCGPGGQRLRLELGLAGPYQQVHAEVRRGPGQAGGSERQRGVT